MTTVDYLGIRDEGQDVIEMLRMVQFDKIKFLVTLSVLKMSCLGTNVLNFATQIAAVETWRVDPGLLVKFMDNR